MLEVIAAAQTFVYTDGLGVENLKNAVAAYDRLTETTDSSLKNAIDSLMAIQATLERPSQS